VVLPTIGRPEQLRVALASVAGCRPRPSEVIVVDQSDDGAVAAMVAQFAGTGAVHVRSSGRGLGLALNEGLRRARHEVVFGTHDDCSVAEDWIAVGWELAAAMPSCIFTGRVLPEGNPDVVPSTKDDPRPRDFTGELKCDVLYPANMVIPRSLVLSIGGFDERFQTAAEDNDLCYRWLRGKRPLRYEPRLVVWHRDWRTPAELQQLYVRYGREQGRFYAKHLRRGDWRILRFLAAELVYLPGVLRAALVDAVTRRRPWMSNELRSLVFGLVPGLVTGWRDVRPRGSAGR
jgi:GT2 family glycosyltransferase